MPKRHRLAVSLIAALAVCTAAVAEDWPMWRANSNRTATTSEQLDDGALQLHWKRRYAAPEPAWDRQREVSSYGGPGVPILQKQSYDIAYQPVVAGGRVYVGSMNSDWVAALDLATGAEIWRFYTDGPVRFAPVANGGKIYFGSDDGFLYCLDTEGRLLWKKRGGPTNRKVLGNDRMMSVWPVRGTPVIPTATVRAENPEYKAWLRGFEAADGSCFSVETGSDDAEEFVADRSMYLDSVDLELGQEHVGENDIQLIGIRFSNRYYGLPWNARIDEAFVQFKTDERKGGDVPLVIRIYGELSVDSQTFGTAVGNISSRRRTTTYVDWNVEKWLERGSDCDAQATPDVTAVIQEIVSRQGWSEASAVTLIFERIDGDGIRCAESKEGDGVGPKLYVMSPDVTASQRGLPQQYFDSEHTDTDVLYFAAGTYPYEGSFTYALHKDTGEKIWCNDSAYMYFTDNPHGGAEGYNGNGPEGHLCTANDSKVLVPNARNRPACFDRGNGDLLFHEISRSNSSKGDGGYHVTSVGNRFYVNAQAGARAFDLDNGHRSDERAPALYDEDHLRIMVGDTLFDAGRIFGYAYDGSDFYGGGPWDDSKFGVSGGAFQVDLPARPAGLLAADGHLIVTTVDGWIYCYGEGAPQTGVKTYDYAPAQPATIPMADEILDAANYQDGSRGICVLLGLEDGSLMEAIAAGSDMTVVAFETDAAKVQAVRERLDAVGLYGHKAHIIGEDFVTADVPSYCARVITSEKDVPADAALGAEVWRVLRPYGGTAVLDAAMLADVEAFAASLPKAKVARAGCFATLTKVGKLPGAADWTHQHCNVQQTTLSEDQLVKLPLGVLWFGGSADNTNDAVLPRHGHGPSPQVVGGRYYVQGRDGLRCVDAYTGRVLWEKVIPNLGQFSDYTDHQAGQIALGDNYVSTEEAVYVLGSHADNDWPTECLVLDAATGEQISRFTLPNGERWGAIAVYRDYLIAPASPMLQDVVGYNNAGHMFKPNRGWVYQDSDPTVGVGGVGTYNGSTSKKLYVLNRTTGDVVWSAEAGYGFFHNSIVAGSGKLFVMDRLPWDPGMTLEERLNWDQTNSKPGKRSGNAPRAGEDNRFKEARLTAYDIASGRKVWEHTHDDARLFGSWLAYSAEHDVLLECQRNSRDYWEGHARSKNMAAWKGADGSLLWNALGRSYWGGPVMLNSDMIITQSGNDMGAVNLLTGEPYLVPSGVTGEPSDFAGFKRYGCGTGIACKNLMIFRSGNAGYYDLNTLSGTGNWGGFKTGCTVNLMPANGLIVAPEYTRTCGCSYQFQTSCALIHRPDVEQWTCNKNLGEQFAARGGRMKNVGVNFGAVGDRVDNAGILWMEYPFGEPAAGYNYQIPVGIAVDGDVEYFRHHSLTVAGDGLKWVAASGVEGASTIIVDMVGDAKDTKGKRVRVASPAEAYDVTLYFADPNEKAQAGDRVFSVAVNGIAAGTVDVAAAVGARKILVKKVSNVLIGEAAKITLTATAGSTLLCGVGFDSLPE